MSPLPPDLRSIGPEWMYRAGGPVRRGGGNSPFFFRGAFDRSMASCHILAKCSFRLIGWSGPGTLLRIVAFQATELYRSLCLVCVGVWPVHRRGAWNGHLPLGLLSLTVDQVWCLNILALYVRTQIDIRVLSSALTPSLRRSADDSSPVQHYRPKLTWQPRKNSRNPVDDIKSRIIVAFFFLIISLQSEVMVTSTTWATPSTWATKSGSRLPSPVGLVPAASVPDHPPMREVGTTRVRW